MSAGQIQKPGSVSKQNVAVEVKASTVDLSQEPSVDKPEVQVAPKAPKLEKLDKVQKRAKGVKWTPLDVTATEIGFYGNKRIKVGDKFKLDDVSDFSEKWMKRY